MNKKENGFTLIEIGIVLFVVGILVALMIPSFTQGIKDTALARESIVLSKKALQNIKILRQDCSLNMGVVVGVNGISPAISSTNSISDLLSKGRENVNPAYYSCYDGANLVPFTFPTLDSTFGNDPQYFRPENNGSGTQPFVHIQTTNEGVAQEMIKQMGYTSAIIDTFTYQNVKPYGFSIQKIIGKCYDIKIYLNE